MKVSAPNTISVHTIKICITYMCVTSLQFMQKICAQYLNYWRWLPSSFFLSHLGPIQERWQPLGHEPSVLLHTVPFEQWPQTRVQVSPYPPSSQSTNKGGHKFCTDKTQRRLDSVGMTSACIYSSLTWLLTLHDMPYPFSSVYVCFHNGCNKYIFLRPYVVGKPDKVKQQILQSD